MMCWGSCKGRRASLARRVHDQPLSSGVLGVMIFQILKCPKALEEWASPMSLNLCWCQAMGVVSTQLCACRLAATGSDSAGLSYV
jgi:hypothetical protein